MKKFLSLLLALVMVFSLAACGSKDTTESGSPANSGNPTNSGSPSGTENPGTEPYAGPDWDAIDSMSYEDASEELYFYHLEEYYNLLQAGKAEVDNNSLRWAMLAVAAAKLEGLALMQPGTSQGGNYAISRVIPRSDTTNDWGLDEYRYGYFMVASDFLTPAQRTELVGIWNDCETEAEYYAKVKTWLADNGMEQADTYSTGITTAPQTWDVLATSRAANSQYIAPTYSPLMRYDGKNELQPALATSYEVSDDGLVYTFHIREGLTWVDQQGRKVADLTAQDWVTGLMHCADNADELGYLLSTDGGCGLKNWDAYVNGEITDFSQVGVEAVDDHTLVYTLETKCPFFMSMLGYGCFAPLSRSYYENQGGGFGAEFNPADESYVYGTDPSHIAYCGEFLITNYTEDNIIRYTANESYWDYDNMNIHELNYIWYDSADTLAGYNNALSGLWSGAGLNTNAVVQAKQDLVPGTDKSYYDTYAYVSATNSTSYVGFYNIFREATTDVAYDDGAASTMTEEQLDRARAAMNNVHFRLALNYGTDRGAVNATSVGEDLKYASLINTYVPGNFVQLEEAVTIDINGTATNFPAGTWFGEIVQAQLDADGIKAKVWDPNGDDGLGSSGGFDGWYNVNNARDELAIAIAELAEAGVEITAENPIYLDYPFYAANENYANKANALKQTLEASLEGKVIINLVECDLYQWYYAGYYTDYGYEANYHIYDLSGWGPDYKDPATYLDTYLPYYSGYMIKCIGLF